LVSYEKQIKAASLTISKPAAAHHLPQTRNTRADHQYFPSVVLIVGLQFTPSKRAWTNQCHPPRDDVQELRKLVNRKATAKSGKPAAHSRIFERLPVFGVISFYRSAITRCVVHRSKLEHLERLTELSDTGMGEDREPTRKHSYNRGHQHENRQPKDEERKRCDAFAAVPQTQCELFGPTSRRRNAAPDCCRRGQLLDHKVRHSV